MTIRRVPVPLAAAAVGTVGTIWIVASGLLAPFAAQVIDDMAQLAAGIAATAACWWTARRYTGTQRAWRIWMGIGTAGWSIGQAIWSWYQLFTDTAMPSPSWADAGYLTLPVFALSALTVLVSSGRPALGPATRRPSRLVVVLDGLMVVGSLFVLTWATALGAVARAGAPSTFAFTVAIAYPITDLALAVIVVLLIAGSRAPAAARRQLTLLGAGLLALTFSDSVFAYLVAKGADTMPPLADAGFIAGPALIAVAAATAPAMVGERPMPRGRREWGHLLLPYVPVVATGVLLAVQLGGGQRPDSLEIGASVVVIVLLLIRQAITMVENTVLLERVSEGQERLAYQAFHDALTGLANRALFRDRLDHALALHRRDGRPLAVLFLDLDDFKSVNDRFGHGAGDRLLQAAGERLRACVRAGDTVARLGGDEFAILMESGGEPGEAAGERIMEALSRPFELDGRTVIVGASVGLVEAGDGEGVPSADTLLSRADAAMYAGKRRGKGRMVRYRIDLTDGSGRSDLAYLLAAAVADGRGLDVHYQPIVRLADATVVGVEALARWTHPNLGQVPADVFIATAERVGLVGALDDFVLDRACHDAAGFTGAWAGIAVQVNMSAARLGRPGHEAEVRATLRRHGLDPTRLVLELTETARLDDLVAAVRSAGRLNALGVGFALDDFGTGYNALAQLHALPIRTVKLDRVFTTADGGRGDAMCRSIVAICTQVGISVIAEGIETVSQAAAMAKLGCEYGQGHHFGRPGPLRMVAPAGAAAGATAGAAAIVDV